MKDFIKYSVREPLPDDRKVSYSQFAMYSTCPHKWNLSYIQKLSISKASVHTMFGTAIHETIQQYLTVLYTDSVKAANQMDLHGIFLNIFKKLYAENYEKTKEHVSTPAQLAEFYEDAKAILDYIRRHRGKYFTPKNEELIGIEVPLYHPVITNHNKIFMVSYLDVVTRNTNTGRIRIIDIKTSTNGWNKYQKADKTKMSQLVLYKQYYAEQYGVDADNIDIVYIVVKRKLLEGAMFPQKRIQEVKPASGKPTRNKLLREISSWVSESFNDDGSYNTTRTYPAIAGKNYKNCKYCEFADDQDLCPIEKRIK